LVGVIVGQVITLVAVEEMVETKMDGSSLQIWPPAPRQLEQFFESNHLFESGLVPYLCPVVPIAIPSWSSRGFFGRPNTSVPIATRRWSQR
jgi:hypothetical protein